MTTRWAIISLSGIISDRQSHNICSFFLLLQADNQPLIFKFTSFCDALGILVIFYDPYANIFLPCVQIKPPKRTADEAEGSAEAEQPKAKKAKAAKPVCPFDLLWCADSVFRSQLSGESKKVQLFSPAWPPHCFLLESSFFFQNYRVPPTRVSFRPMFPHNTDFSCAHRQNTRRGFSHSVH